MIHKVTNIKEFNVAGPHETMRIEYRNVFPKDLLNIYYHALTTTVVVPSLANSSHLGSIMRLAA